MARYVRGQEARLTGTFLVGEVPTDPGATTLTVTDPLGATTTPAPVKSSTGIYYADVVLPTEGLWHYRWEGTAPALGAAEGKLEVRSDF